MTWAGVIITACLASFFLLRSGVGDQVPVTSANLLPPVDWYLVLLGFGFAVCSLMLTLVMVRGV